MEKTISDRAFELFKLDYQTMHFKQEIEKLYELDRQSEEWGQLYTDLVNKMCFFYKDYLVLATMLNKTEIQFEVGTKEEASKSMKTNLN